MERVSAGSSVSLDRLRGLLRQSLHLGGDDREAFAGGAGARRLDGGVERQPRGLRLDGLDQLDHGADAFGGGGEAAHGEVGVAEIRDGTLGRVLGGGRFGAAVDDQRKQAARRVGDRGDVAAGASGGFDRMRGALGHVGVALAQIGGGDADFLAGGLELTVRLSMVSRKRWVKKPRLAWRNRLSASRLR